MRNIFKYISVIILLLLCTVDSRADQFSYVYIQGDKITPFYVKFEEQMLPRFGKNYSIISQLTPGPIHIQILFQQNLYPPQDFVILVPENGFRGFLLTKKDNAYTLYDIQQQFYLNAGNTQDDDHIPASQPVAAANTNGDIGPAPDSNVVPEFTAPTGEHTVVIAPVKKEADGPAFMDMELNNERTPQADNGINTKSDADFKGQLAIVNSDCPHALENDLFDAIYKKANDKSGKARLKYLLDKTDYNCFTTNQIRTLTRMLDNDPERYTFLKKAYSRVTDQSMFPKLEMLLSSREWKDYFKLILP